MKGYKYGIRNVLKALLPVAALLSVGSCIADREAAESDGRRTGTVRIGAYLEEATETRAQGAAAIQSGTYYMTYPNYSDRNTHSVCTVNFYDGVGVTTTSENKELKWTDVGSLTYDDTQTNFFLDNVAPPAGEPNATEILFTDAYHPFDAAVYAGDKGYNDLLWGYAFIKLGASNTDINIGIHHYLSRVSVIVTVDNTLENTQAIDFEKGSVKITNVITKGKSYSRTTGSINFADEPVYEDLELAVEGDWGSVTPDETTSGITYYQTKNFVLPPQALRTDERRPRLVLDVPQPDGSIRTYSGVIPRVMMVDGSPATMAFDKEKNLTLKVKISQDQLRIESIVAYVQNWVDKGTFLVSAYNGAINSYEDLLELIKLYPEQDEDAIGAYGFHHTYGGKNEWSFNILADLTINIEDVKGKMAEPLPDFRFDLTSHTFTLINETGKEATFGTPDTADSETAQEAAKILHDLLRLGTVPESLQ